MGYQNAFVNDNDFLTKKGKAALSDFLEKHPEIRTVEDLKQAFKTFSLDAVSYEHLSEQLSEHLTKLVDELGELTEQGKFELSRFLYDNLRPDDACLLTQADLSDSFKIFSLDELASRELEAVVSNLIWRSLKPDATKRPDGFFDEDGFIEHRICIEKDDSGFLVGFRARLIDTLGLTPFDPSEQESTEVEYLVDKLLPLHGVHMFVAKPETLKTWLAYRIAIDVSQGLAVLGRFVTRQGRAVIIDFEMGPKRLMRRLRMLGADKRVLHTSFPPKLTLNDEQFWTELKKLCPRFVVIDGLGSGSGEDFGELDSRFAGPLGRAGRFAAQHECTFLFLHHSPKAATRSDAESLFRGTGAIRSKVDSAYYFHRLPDGPKGEERAEVSSVKSREGTRADTFAIQISDERGVELSKAGGRRRRRPQS